MLKRVDFVCSDNLVNGTILNWLPNLVVGISLYETFLTLRFTGAAQLDA